MQLVIGIILLVTFFAFIFYAVRGGNMLLGLFAMALIWSALGAIGGVITWKTFGGSAGIIQSGPEGFGPTAVNILFGSWFGRVLIQTGIARTIIRKAVELGGDKPALTTVLLCIVVGVIFTASYGAGAVVAIGVIVFPIMLSLGVNKTLATGSFVMAVSSGLYFNSALLSQAKGTMKGEMFTPKVADFNFSTGTWYTFAAIAMVVSLIAIVLLVLFNTRKSARVQAWAAPEVDTTTEQKNVSLVACLAPLIPVALIILGLVVPWFKGQGGFSSILAIIIAVAWALLLTGNMKSWQKVGALVEKTFLDGTTDVGLVLAFLLFMQMFAKAAGACSSLLKPIVQPILPHNAMLLFLLFGILGFMALFRGPLTIWGAGTATFAILAASSLYPLAVLFPLFYVMSTAVNTSVCPTQSWVSWAIGYNQVSIKDHLLKVLPFALPVCLVLELVAYFFFHTGVDVPPPA